MKKTILRQLYLTPGVGNLTIQKIMKHFPKEKENISAIELAELGEVKNIAGFVESFQEVERKPHLLKELEKIPHITMLDSDYPESLKEMYRYPCLLFYKGDLSLLRKPSLGVVGTREKVFQGKEILHHLVKPLLKDLVIVSGLAKGCDTLAHTLALNEKGKTIAVLGNGLETFYPLENKVLQEKIAKEGLLLSEYLPFATPKKHHFPMRNRIIAGISLGTVVLAAKKRSGSLITAQLALDHNKEVFAVPGSPLDELYSGCLNLIQEGAKCVQNSSDILEEVKFLLPK